MVIITTTLRGVPHAYSQNRNFCMQNTGTLHLSGKSTERMIAITNELTQHLKLDGFSSMAFVVCASDAHKECALGKVYASSLRDWLSLHGMHYAMQMIVPFVMTPLRCFLKFRFIARLVRQCRAEVMAVDTANACV